MGRYRDEWSRFCVQLGDLSEGLGLGRARGLVSHPARSVEDKEGLVVVLCVADNGRYFALLLPELVILVEVDTFTEARILKAALRHGPITLVFVVLLLLLVVVLLVLVVAVLAKLLVAVKIERLLLLSGVEQMVLRDQLHELRLLVRL